MSKLPSIASLVSRLNIYMPDATGSVKFEPVFCDAPRLRGRSVLVASMFEEGRPAEPPSRERAIAIQKLRRKSEALTQKDWIRVAWGLCDQLEHHGTGMVDERIMLPVLERLEHQKNTQSISRKFWFGLLHSYFAFEQAMDNVHHFWKKLREHLLSSLPILLNSQTRTRKWMEALVQHEELLTERAGHSLVDEVFSRYPSNSSTLLSFFSIPESSWLWKRVFQMQIEKLAEISEEKFLEVIPKFVKTAAKHPTQIDALLVGLLNRYDRSSRKDQSHQELKDFALVHWKNPQISSSIRWGLVSDRVRKMVSRWFAKDDLLLFFSLLQGSGSVDQARLDFWLQFVDQIEYTRIVMGYHAISRMDRDFVDYRTNNRGRFSELVGGGVSNNAFIMRIGDYFFVEFSETGNACYIFDSRTIPFEFDSSKIQRSAMRNQAAALDRILHQSIWQYNALTKLRNLGIHKR